MIQSGTVLLCIILAKMIQNRTVPDCIILGVVGMALGRKVKNVLPGLGILN